MMRGDDNPQGAMFSYFSPEDRVPKDHPLRRIREDADAVLKELSKTFDEMYSHTGRPSIPPERLLKAQLLMALYSVRSDRMFCEQLDYNILFRWFLDMDLDSSSFVPTVFTKNRERLLRHRVAERFFDAVVRRARRAGLLSDEHFTVDGTLIEAWASMKSFKQKDRSDDDPPNGPGNVDVDFRGQRRSNKTHRSTTDPEARLMRKSFGQSAQLCYAGHVLMENRHGLVVDVMVGDSSRASAAEVDAARAMLDRQARKRVRPSTLGADKGYHTRAFVAELRRRGIRPHVAMKSGHTTPGLDRRTTRHDSYQLSQRSRKRVEEIFGWCKTVAGLRKTRFRGIPRVQLQAQFAAAAYNLLRMSRLAVQAT